MQSACFQHIIIWRRHANGNYCRFVLDEAQHTMLSMGTIIAVASVMPVVLATECGGLGNVHVFQHVTT